MKRQRVPTPIGPVTSYNLDEFAAEPLPRPQEQILLLLRWIANEVQDDRFHAVEVIEDLITEIVGAVDEEGANAIVVEATDRNLIE